MLQRVIQFLTDEIWHLPLATLSWPRRLLLRLARILLLAAHGYREHGTPLRASALTFYTLLSIVPVLALAFGIAQGFGFGERLRVEITERLEGYENIAQKVIGFSESMLANTEGGLIAGLGILLLFWSVVQLLSHVERSLNDIWGVRAGRPLTRRLADYLSLMLLAPILWIFSSSVSVFIASQARNAAASPAFEPLGPMVTFMLELLPLISLWVLFAFVYWFLPFTRVSPLASFVGGFLASLSYIILQRAYVGLQIGVAKANAIYGSFAALPLFLVWLQLSWLIMLIGAELAYAIDNVGRYQAERLSSVASDRLRNLLSLRVVEICAKTFERGEPALTDAEIADATASSVRLVRAVLHDLVASGVLSAVQRDGETSGYQPAMDVDLLTIKRVLDGLEGRGRSSLTGVGEDHLRAIRERLERLDTLVEESPDNIPLVQLPDTPQQLHETADPTSA